MQTVLFITIIRISRLWKEWIAGSTVREDITARIFERFCVGK